MKAGVGFDSTNRMEGMTEMQLIYFARPTIDSSMFDQGASKSTRRIGWTKKDICCWNGAARFDSNPDIEQILGICMAIRDLEVLAMHRHRCVGPESIGSSIKSQISTPARHTIQYWHWDYLDFNLRRYGIHLRAGNIHITIV
jgi:hypothetical protein